MNVQAQILRILMQYISMDKLYIGKKSPLIKSSNIFFKFEGDEFFNLTNVLYSRRSRRCGTLYFIYLSELDVHCLKSSNPSLTVFKHKILLVFSWL